MFCEETEGNKRGRVVLCASRGILCFLVFLVVDWFSNHGWRWWRWGCHGFPSWEGKWWCCFWVGVEEGRGEEDEEADGLEPVHCTGERECACLWQQRWWAVAAEPIACGVPTVASTRHHCCHPQPVECEFLSVLSSLFACLPDLIWVPMCFLTSKRALL